MKLVYESDLRAWSGYQRRGDLINFLRQNGIPFHYGQGGRVITTQTAIDSSLGFRQNKPQQYDYIP